MRNKVAIIFSLVFCAGWYQMGLAAETASLDCLNYIQKTRQLQCGYDNYLVRFGYHYCQTFSENIQDFSQAGRPVILAIGQCLLNEMQNDSTLTCDNAKETSQQKHIGCYVQNQFCGLGFFDKLRIYNIVYNEMQDPGFRKTMAAILSACGSQSGDRDYDLFFKNYE